MKRIYTLVFAVILLSACKHYNNSGSFTVTGKILHANNTKIILQSLPYGGQHPVIIDSTVLDKDSSFTLKSIANEEGLYQLLVPNSTEILFINDAKDIKINVDVDHYKSYTTEGSQASKELHQFLDRYSKEYLKLITAVKHADSLKNANAKDSILNVAITRQEEQIKNINAEIKQSFTATKSPALKYYLLGKAFATMKPDEIKKMADDAANEFAQHNGLAYMRTIATNALNKYVSQHKQVPKPAPDTSAKIHPDSNSKPIAQPVGKKNMVDSLK